MQGWRCETVWWFCMAVLYVKMLAKGTCGVRTRARSQSDAVPITGVYRRTFHESLHWILRIDIQHARAQAVAHWQSNACSAGAARAARAGSSCWLSAPKRRENGRDARADGRSMGPSTLDRENGDVQSSVRSRRVSRGRRCVPRPWHCLEIAGPRVPGTRLAAGWDWLCSLAVAACWQLLC